MSNRGIETRAWIARTHSRRNDPRVPMFKSLKKDADRDTSTSSSHSSRSSSRHSHDNDVGDDVLENSHNQTRTPGPVLWKARVHIQESDNTVHEGAVYKSESPLPIRGRRKLQDVRSGTPNKPATQAHSEEYEPLFWDGYVFEIVCDAYVSHSIRTIRARKSIEELEIDSFTENMIVIRSPFLHHKLRSITKYYPNFFQQDDAKSIGNASFPQTWGFLLHHFEAMENFLQSKEDDELKKVNPQSDRDRDILSLEKEHLQYLYNFLKPHYESIVAPCLRLLDQSPPQISFETLWYIFPPGTDVYILADLVYHVDVVFGVSTSKDNYDEYEYLLVRGETFGPTGLFTAGSWILATWNLDTNGRTMGRVQRAHRIRRFEGLRDVTSLSICPVSYWDKFDGGERRRNIMQRNIMLSKSFQQGHLLTNYHGPCKGATTHYTGKLVVDHKRGLIDNRQLGRPPSFTSSFDNSSWFADYDQILIYSGSDSGLGDEPDSPSLMHGSVASIEDAVEQEPGAIEQHELSEHQLLLISPRVWAFALKTKQWLLIQADYMTEVTQSKESLDNLVLEKTALQTIKALATRQISKRLVWAADFIEGKGTGQIMLLHGPPGVGKTYTVEAIAEFLYRPLLALTVADIGTVETRVEAELFKWFSLAEAWNAVLLVDEADVFLERRQNRDLARNGLVSAFLRRMEYFKGLLFLTTNRVGQIDDAFISRVHAAIGYPTFTPQDRVQIWQGFFRKLEKERAGKIQIARGAKKWVLEKAEGGGAQLNGRDIRNALQTAITLAEAEYEEDPDFDPEKTTIVVDQSHFERVLEISEKFHSYLKSIKKEDERKRAANRFDRNDFHDGAVADSIAYPED